MKAKIAILVGAGLLGLFGAAQAGPRIGVTINPVASCRPVVNCRPAVFCPPVIRSYPVSAWCPQPAFYSWGPNVVVYSSVSSGYSNVTPVMNYGVNTPIYRVPDPIVTAQPIVVYPTSNFGWKH